MPDVTPEKLKEINTAAADFMGKIAALNNKNKDNHKVQDMQKEVNVAIHEASANFKSAEAALNRNSAMRAINDFKDDKKKAEEKNAKLEKYAKGDDK